MEFLCGSRSMINWKAAWETKGSCGILTNSAKDKPSRLGRIKTEPRPFEPRFSFRRRRDVSRLSLSGPPVAAAGPGENNDLWAIGPTIYVCPGTWNRRFTEADDPRKAGKRLPLPARTGISDQLFTSPTG